MPGSFGSPILGATGLVILLTAHSLAAAAPADSVDQAMEASPTVAGLSAYARMKACGIQINESSFTEFGPNSGIPPQAIKQGDGILELMLTLPPILSASSPDPALYQDVVARWYIQSGKAYAQNGWALRIQYQPAPLEWMYC